MKKAPKNKELRMKFEFVIEEDEKILADKLKGMQIYQQIEFCINILQSSIPSMKEMEHLKGKPLNLLVELDYNTI